MAKRHTQHTHTHVPHTHSHTQTDREGGSRGNDLPFMPLTRRSNCRNLLLSSSTSSTSSFRVSASTLPPLFPPPLLLLLSPSIFGAHYKCHAHAACLYNKQLYIHAHTHTHHKHTYVYIAVCVCVRVWLSVYTHFYKVSCAKLLPCPAHMHPYPAPPPRPVVMRFLLTPFNMSPLFAPSSVDQQHTVENSCLAYWFVHDKTKNTAKNTKNLVSQVGNLIYVCMCHSQVYPA